MNKMKIYKTKSKLFGYQIGLNNDNLYVAVPAKYFKGDNAVRIVVINGTETELIKTVLAEDREYETTFKDKFKPDENYLLYYFKIKEF